MPKTLRNPFYIVLCATKISKQCTCILQYAWMHEVTQMIHYPLKFRNDFLIYARGKIFLFLYLKEKQSVIHTLQKLWTAIKNLRIQCAFILQKKFKEFLKCLKTLSPFCILICNYSFKAMLVYSLLCENAQNNSNDVVSS